MGESQGVGVGTGAFRGVAGLAGAAAAGAGTAGLGAPSGGGEEGDFISSGITAGAQTSGAEDYGENVNFYQLEDAVSTRRARKKWRGWRDLRLIRALALDTSQSGHGCAARLPCDARGW